MESSMEEGYDFELPIHVKGSQAHQGKKKKNECHHVMFHKFDKGRGAFGKENRFARVRGEEVGALVMRGAATHREGFSRGGAAQNVPRKERYPESRRRGVVIGKGKLDDARKKPRHEPELFLLNNSGKQKSTRVPKASGEEKKRVLSDDQADCAHKVKLKRLIPGVLGKVWAARFFWRWVEWVLGVKINKKERRKKGYDSIKGLTTDHVD